MKPRVIGLDENWRKRMSTCLLMNDMPSYGKIALAAMNPILSYQGHQVYSLPTGLVSMSVHVSTLPITKPSSPPLIV